MTDGKQMQNKGRACVRVGETISFPFLVGGTTADPKFSPDVKGIAVKTLEGLIPPKRRRS